MIPLLAQHLWPTVKPPNAFPPYTHLILCWIHPRERTWLHQHMDRQTDGQTDRVKSIKPSFNFTDQGIYIMYGPEAYHAWSRFKHSFIDLIVPFYIHVTTYIQHFGITDIGEHQMRYWHVVWWYSPITWIIIDLSWNHQQGPVVFNWGELHRVCVRYKSVRCIDLIVA